MGKIFLENVSASELILLFYLEDNRYLKNFISFPFQ